MTDDVNDSESLASDSVGVARLGQARLVHLRHCMPKNVILKISF